MRHGTLALVLVACGHSVPPAKNPPASSSSSAPAPAPVKKVMAAFTLPAPKLGITAPMTGEPSSSALEEARLVPTTCDKISAEETEATIKEMRAEVDADFQQWVSEQPSCWQAMREAWEARLDMIRGGGLGLSGVGEGGGGAGYGIGLGSIGTIGHGAGIARKAASFSTTNNQIASVDEADIVKTDGSYVYVLTKGALHVIEALSPKVVSTAPIQGTAREMFVEGDRAVVFSGGAGTPAPPCTYGYSCVFRGDGTTTKISIFDLKSRSEPKLVRQMELSGSLMAARRIGSAVHTVVADNDAAGPRWLTWPAELGRCGVPQGTVMTKLAQLKAENEKLIRARPSRFPTFAENGRVKPMCSILRTRSKDGNAFTSLVSFDMKDDARAPVTASIESRPGAVFASDSGLYVSVVRQRAGARSWYSYYGESVDEASEIHKFHIGASPAETRYVGSGTVPGHVLNQFAMDEWYGYLRVATTKGQVPDPKVESELSVLAESASGALTRVGAITGIARGEDIRAVRFDNERGYVVTFKKTDPLFVIDTLDPQKPNIMGELKIPGFSSYIHRVDPEHLLSIGFDANDHGDFAYFDGVILQLFDVKSPTDPRLLHKEKIGTRGSSSEAATNHLAFNYMPSRGLLALPMTICEGGGDGVFGALSFSGLLVYDVDVERGFKRLGGVDHGAHGVDCNTWWSDARSQVKRSVFLDDLVYSIAEDRVKVQKLDKLGADLADLHL